jgi:glucose dehydrogenase
VTGRIVVVALLGLALAGCNAKTEAPSAPPSAYAPLPGATGASANFAPNDPPGEWRRQARDFANTRFSPLSQITAANVGRLKIAWSFTDGIPYGHEAGPLVVGQTMYLVSPFPNTAYALDLSKPGAPIKWIYQPHPRPIAIGKACCDAVNRGPTFADNKLVYSLLDGEAVAVDAASGKPVWRTRLGDPAATGMTITMSPLVVGQSVLVGNSGGEMGVRGQLTALDLNSGKVQWIAYSTGPDRDVLIGPGFRAPYPSLAGKDLGVSSWPAGGWVHGGGTVWGSAARRQPVDQCGLRPRSDHRAGQMGLSIHPARSVGLRWGQRRHPHPGAVGRKAAPAAGASGPQRFCLHHGSDHRQSAGGQAVRNPQLGHQHRSCQRPAGARPRQGRAGRTDGR